MTFLALAAKVGWPVARYLDTAEAHLGKTAHRTCFVANTLADSVAINIRQSRTGLAT
jgi:hypothetical protein